ncbi:MAG: TIGR02281 family clan AA aspartic protease [Pseudomonadota bacterium]
MQNVDTAQLIYLGLLAVVLGGAFLVSQRQKLSTMMQQAAIWFFIFVGGIAVFGMWDDIRDDLGPEAARFVGDNTIEVARQGDGHYYLTLDLNGSAVEFMIDTGATDMVLTQEAAATAGINPADLRYIGQASTANGTVRTAPVRVERVSLGPIEDQNVFAVVNEGQMDMSLLGMGYLQRYGRIEIEGGTLRLVR